MNLSNLINDYLNYLKLNEMSNNTISSYRIDLEQLNNYLTSCDIKITDVNVEHLTNFLIKLDNDYIKLKNKQLSAATKCRKITSIRSFFNYLLDIREIITQNPANKIKMPKIPKRIPKHLSLDDSLNILDNIRGRGVYKLRNLAIMTLFLNVGLRVSEMVNLKVSDVQNNSLVFIGKGNKERSIPLNSACIKAVNKYLEVRPNVDTDRLFITERNTGFSVGGMQYLVKSHMKKAEINHKKYSTHDLRHTAATLTYNSSKDIRAIQKMLGHTSIATTQIYTQIDTEQLLDVINSNPLNKHFDVKKNKNNL